MGGAVYTPKQQNWKWFQNDSAESPTQLANENIKPTLPDNTSIIRLRVCIAETGGKADTNVAIAVQYDTDAGFPSPQSFGAAPQHWNYANGLGTEGNVVANLLLTDTAVKNEFCESGANVVAIGASTTNELDIAVVPTASVSGSTTYYFRVVGDGTAIPLNTGETYPQVLTTANLLTKSLSDTITLSDSRTGKDSVSKADTITLSDAIAKKPQTINADTIILSDGSARKPMKALSDIITLEDSFSRTVSFVRLYEDTITLTDGISKAVSLSLADAITLSDDITLQRIINLQLSDTITLSDVITKKPIVVLADTITPMDQVIKHFGKTQADNVVLSDAVYNAVKITRTDTITITDDVAKKIAKVVADQITLTDLFSSVLSGAGITVFAFTEAETGEEYYLVNEKFITKEGGGKSVVFGTLPIIMFEIETGEVFLVINQHFITKTRGESHEY